MKPKTNILIRSAWCLMLAGIFLPTAWAAEFTHVQLARVLTAYQGSAEPPDPGYQAYAFRALAFHTPDDAEVNASLTLPDSGPSYFLDPGWVIGSLEIRDELYFGPEDVDAVWPDGVYGISLEPAAGVTQPASVELAPAAYPPVPVVANYNDLATLNPGDPFTISWLPFAGAGAGDCIQVEVYSWGLESWVYRSAEPGTAEAISPVASSLELPAETFQPLDSYSIFITFHKVHVNDTAQIPGTRLTVVSSASTECWIDTGETVETDTQAPWLVSVDPASGSKAAADTPVIFTFDEPMQPGVSIEWKTLPSGGEVTYEWNTEQTVLTCLPSGTWATGQRVRWTLNPSAVSLLFADVAGNFLSPDVNTGSFTIAAATYGTAPAEWLPGPFTVIEPDGSGAASLKVAAESLRGHMVQKSADLKNWQTIQTITSEVSLMEIPLSDLAPGEPAFFRLAQFAAPLSIAAEEDATVSQLVLPAGGTISTTGPDGTFYELVVPPGALTYPVEISLTPLAAVAGLPLSGGLVAGVQLQPDGLEFLQPATLRMRPTGGINLEAFTGFSAEVDGVNLTWEPWIFENGTDVLLQVTHFSTVGGANGTDAEQAAKPPACDPLGRLKETVANYLKLYTKYAQAGNPTVAQYYMDEAHRVVIEYYTNVIMPQMVAAKTNDALVRCAVKDLVAVVSMGRSIGEDSPVLDLNPPEMKEAIRNAGLMAYQRCAENGDLREMANIMSILAQDQLLGTLAFSAGEFQDMTQGCLRFKLDFRSEVGYDGWMYAGHHVLEAKDIVMEPTIGDGLSFNAKGPLKYLEVSVTWVSTSPECIALGSRNLQKTDSELEVFKGFLLAERGESAECRCDRKAQSAEATGEKAVDFLLIMDMGLPGESWEQPSGGDLDCFDPVWIPYGDSLWLEAMAETHEEEIFHEKTGEFNLPLYLVIKDFDYLDKLSGGRRKIAQKHYRNALADDPFFIWKNLREETLITIWHDPLPVPE